MSVDFRLKPQPGQKMASASVFLPHFGHATVCASCRFCPMAPITLPMGEPIPTPMPRPIPAFIRFPPAPWFPAAVSMVSNERFCW